MDAPSLPLLSSSDSFSPSAFMSVDTRAGLASFGGVNQTGIIHDRSTRLRSRSEIKIPGRYLNPVTPAKPNRMSKRTAEVLVRLFFANPSVDYCGGKVGRGVNFQSCVAPSSSCLVSSHANKAETFESNRLYILTPSKA